MLVRPLQDSDIRASLVNCSKGEATRLRVPLDLAERRWDQLDFLGWRDPQAPARACIVTERDDALVGITLRAGGSGAGAVRGQRGMCSLCMTVRSGSVELMVAPRAGRAGKQGHTVGTYVCSDLACSLLVRDLVSSGSPQMHETLSTEQRVARLRTNLDAFVRRVLRAD